MTATTRRLAVATALAATALLAAAPVASADEAPAPPKLTAATQEAAHEAASAPETLGTLSRFFAREGAVARTAAAPRIEAKTVPVRTLSAEFVAGKPGAAPSTLDYLAATAVSSDGQKASLWTVPGGGAGGKWQVVNIATGDDEARYTALGARKLPGGTVFREPQIDAWYVHDASRVLPLDEDATAAVGAKGTTLNAYRTRVKEAYGDKLPGSGYAKSGKAGGYGPEAAAAPGAAEAPAPGPALADAAGTGTPDTALTTVSTMAGAGALLALALGGATAVRHRIRTRQNPAPDA
ncbi:hypothetical protein ACFY9Q_31130 [Streptomyces sp. NPDC012389]|uniref:hypothetical protein n=1 Tax=unclassified Streptomyces TaxID=2593676 RepID=UPI00081EE23E|nr:MULTISPECIES: hypothetical protein [unclassified Streptomyces]MYR92727.1 hypothetical protein [Streptomyces sp. SID4937]MYX13028.1 hypothetical protein [Streptomyces sp. SID8374]SCD39349.1 hypothetical protein GA0115243_101380 [Streptomyces sp. ScaeMP-e83]